VKRVFSVVASVALVGTVTIANSAQASLQARNRPSPTVTACKLALKYGQPTANIPGGIDAVQVVYSAGSIKVVKAFRGRVPELLKPNEKRLVDAIAARGGTVDLANALNSLIGTCHDAGIIELTPQQLLNVQIATGTITP
jgi:hypothetical protein